MIKTALLVLFACLCVHAQGGTGHSITGTISTFGSDCSASTNCVSLTLLPDQGSVSVTISGTFSGTLQFEASGDGTNFSAFGMSPFAGGAQATSTASPGGWVGSASALQAIRVRASALSSGSAVATVFSSSSNSGIHPSGSSSSGVPSGSILMVNSGSCPASYTEDDSFSGAYLLGTKTANADVGATGGSSSYTPAGSNGTVAFTPTGTNSAPSFTGSPGTVPAETFTGSSTTVPAETFTGSTTTIPAETLTMSSYTPVGTNSTVSWTIVTGGYAASTAHYSPDSFGGSALASGTTSITVPAETFTGTAHVLTGTNGTVTATPLGSNASTTLTPLGSNATSSFTPSGTVAAPTFTGGSGTVPAETFSGTPATLTPPYEKVLFCKAP